MPIYLYRICVINNNGWFVTQEIHGGIYMVDYSTAIERYAAAAKKGDAAAMAFLGQSLLSEGIGYLTSSARYGNQEALDILEELLEHGHSRLLAAREGVHQAGKLLNTSEIQPGSIVQFGHSSLKDEPLDWQVLEVHDDRALLLSRYVLEYRPFHDRWGLVTWENSSLRKYLNDEFWHVAFTEEERQSIARILVKADENPMCNTDPGNDTKDRVFLLSVVEAQKYFAVNHNRQCTYYSGGRQSTRPSWWWLRSPGFNEANAASVGDDGSFQYSYVRDIRGGIRPAIWLKL